MQDLPALKVGNEINKLTSLRDLHVEKCGWTDFSNLRLDSLRTLFVSKAQSLRFIKQLKKLDDLDFWDCVDGDLSPILAHPSLTRINFYPEKKHYSHKLAEVRGELAARNARKV
jgi:internalin A